MDSLSKLTLKGYFEQLKLDVNETSCGRKGAVREKGYETLRDESTYKLLELLIKAVAIVEDVYDNDASLIHEDHVSDYQSMISTLNSHGIAYKGIQEILDIEAYTPQTLGEKKPMQKAKSRKKTNSGNDLRKKTG